MPHATRVVETVADGANSARYDLKSGELAHVQVAIAGTGVALVRVLSTNEAAPGVAQLDTMALPSFRLPQGDAASFAVAGVVAFVIAIDLDSGAGPISAEVRIVSDNVDLSSS